MKVLIVSTSDIHGGAAIAASRLMHALNLNGVQAKMLVRDKHSADENVCQIGGKMQNKWSFYWERGKIFLNNRFSRENLFDVSIANTGVSITELPEFKQADIIHLHWINQGMLSLNEIRKILASGKKVVWTMHDMWAFTGICHHAGNCAHYRIYCGNCPYLKTASPNDLSRKTHQQKQADYSSGKIHFVACSQWLANLAKTSPLTQNRSVTAIPNPINTEIYAPKDKQSVRKSMNLPLDKKIVLFAAVKASDKRKGMDYLIEASKLLKDNNLLFLIAGTNGEEIARQLSVESVNIGFVAPDKMPDVYNAADAFVTPSLQENLPNTIMEAMSCGTPCVGFRIGGIPEMIDHKQTGYVADYKNAEDLANGISWTLRHIHAPAPDVRQKVLNEYDQHIVAEKYKKIYAE